MFRKKAISRKLFRLKKIMTVFRDKKLCQIPVPAVAVKQEEQALFVVIGRKGYVGGYFFNFIKF